MLVDYPEAATFEGYVALICRAREAFHMLMRHEEMTLDELKLAIDYMDDMINCVIEAKALDLATDIVKFNREVLVP